MNEVSPKRLTFSGVFLKIAAASLIFSNFYFFFKDQPHFFSKLQNSDTTWIPVLIKYTIIHLLIFLLLAVLLNRKKKMRLANSDLLTAKDVNREQIEKRNSGSLYVRPRFYFLMPNRMKMLFNYYNKKNAIRITRNIKISEKKLNESVILFGPTGSGKTVSTYFPILKEASGSHSFIVADPKGELHAKTKKQLEAKGFKVFHINFNKPSDGSKPISHHYSLLKNCETYDDIRALSSSILENGKVGGTDEWAEMSKSLLNCFLFHVYDNGGNMKQFVDLFTKLTTDQYEEFFTTKASKKAREEFGLVRRMLKGEGMMAGIFSTLNTKIEVFLYDVVQEIEGSSDFSAGDFRLDKAALFFSFPTAKKTVYSSFVASFLSQLLEKLQEHESVRDEEKQIGRPVVCLFDEFGTSLGKLNNFSDRLATTRSRKLAFILGVQSLQQLKTIYKDDASIIIENAKTKIALRGLTETAELISKMLGEKEFKQISYSSSTNHKGHNMSESVTKKPVMTADEIRQIKTYQCIVIFDNLRGILDDRNIWYYDDFEMFLHKKLELNEEHSNQVMKFLTKFYKDEGNKAKIEKIKHFVRTKILREKELTEEEKMERQLSQKVDASKDLLLEKKAAVKKERKQAIEDEIDVEMSDEMKKIMNNVLSTKEFKPIPKQVDTTEEANFKEEYDMYSDDVASTLKSNNKYKRLLDDDD